MTTTGLISPPPINQWIAVESCDMGTATTMPAGVAMEQVAVTGLNALAPLANYPDKQLLMLFVNGQAFFPVGTAPDFSVSGQIITWLSSTYSVDPTATVIAVYTWTLPPP